jgi:hypothetical protein
MRMTEESPTRRHRRFNLELPLWVRFWEKGREDVEPKEETRESFSEAEQTTTTTISSGGCFFYVAQRPPLGVAVTMRVEIPIRVSGRGGGVLCKGSVVWVSDREVHGKVGVACTIESFKFEPPGGGEARSTAALE